MPGPSGREAHRRSASYTSLRLVLTFTSSRILFWGVQGAFFSEGIMGTPYLFLLFSFFVLVSANAGYDPMLLQVFQQNRHFVRGRQGGHGGRSYFDISGQVLHCHLFKISRKPWQKMGPYFEISDQV